MDFSRLIDPRFWTPVRRIYLVWTLLVFFGFLSVHVYPVQNALWLWLGLVVFGIWQTREAAGLEPHVQEKQQQKTREQQRFFALWLGLIALGLLVSAAAFQIGALGGLLGYLGVFWLGLLAIGHLVTGWWRGWLEPYHLSAAAQLGAALLALFLPRWQYLIAAIAAGGAMLVLLVSVAEEAE